jgi:hypothetical protein
MIRKPIVILCGLILLAGCGGYSPGRLMRTAHPTASELKRDWKNYRVFHRLDSALLYQTRDGKKILLDASWEEVTDAAALERVGFWGATTPVLLIVGHNGAGFGYVYHTLGDTVGVTIIDPDTVRLSYFVQKKGGP